ncbi:MAG TPA: tetraacyldisaccharide 4'-kinase, partial [Pseudolabrys sp.]|nr:tetraacyldisaccharide 4'-kinase [Pseudolabrys sp.]
PAGPLRAPLAAQMDRINALLIVGPAPGGAGVTAAAAARSLPVFYGRLVPDPGAIAALKKRKVLAFAGIGNPRKFFETIEEAGIEAPVCKAFPDHHAFTAEEAAALVMQAEHEGLSLLTTEKDRARMGGDPALAALCARAHTLPVNIEIGERDGLRRLVVAAARKQPR